MAAADIATATTATAKIATAASIISSTAGAAPIAAHPALILCSVGWRFIRSRHTRRSTASGLRPTGATIKRAVPDVCSSYSAAPRACIPRFLPLILGASTASGR